MSQPISLSSALQCAIITAIEQPSQVPERAEDWCVRAQAAVDSKDEEKIICCIDEILSAHSQYRAEFDVRGWLFDLRNVVDPLREAARTAVKQHAEAATVGMTIASICQDQDLSVVAVERALTGLQNKGLIEGFIPGDLNAVIRKTSAADIYR